MKKTKCFNILKQGHFVTKLKTSKWKRKKRHSWYELKLKLIYLTKKNAIHELECTENVQLSFKPRRQRQQ